MLNISHNERVFIKNGIEQNIRNDGRERLDFRFFSLDIGVIANANGSARLKLDNTDVLVGVKVEISEPDSETPKQGKIECSVECSPSASVELDGQGAHNLNVQLTSELDQILSDSKCIDLEELCIIPSKQCWIVYIDALVLESSGNVLDAISLATKAALATTAIPRVEVIGGSNGEEMEIEVSDDETKFFNHHRVPIAVSLTKIGNCFVVDTTLEEEVCMSSRVTVAVNSDGDIAGVHKFGQGGIAPSALLEMLRCARKIGLDLHKKLDGELLKKKEKDKSAEEDQ